MKRSISKAAADKLGDRLRKSEVVSEEDLRQLQLFRLDYDAPLAKVQEILRQDLGLDPTSRIKTPNTIYEKLRRDKTRLSSMQDIAGVRIVRDMTLHQQDALVATICRKFPENRVDDRRATPSHGYRAVHVIVTVAGFPVEIQVRTHDQHLWAELVEKLADRWGRQIRYGGPPDDPERVELGGTRRSIIETIIGTSQAFSIAESRRVELERRIKGGTRPVESGRGAGAYREKVLETFKSRQETKELKARLERAESELRLLFEKALRGLEEE